MPNWQRAWTKHQDDRLIDLWNQPIELLEVVSRLQRSKAATIQRANILRRRGVEMRQRRIVIPPEELPPEERFVPFTMPDNMRYEDDPRAISPRLPVFVPLPGRSGYSAVSGLIGGGRIAR